MKDFTLWLIAGSWVALFGFVVLWMFWRYAARPVLAIRTRRLKHEHPVPDLENARLRSVSIAMDHMVLDFRDGWDWNTVTGCRCPCCISLRSEYRGELNASGTVQFMPKRRVL